jgi:ribose transport system ATP-binding protein
MGEYLLELENISKSFPGVRALDGVSVRVKPGEVHALLGENGAGKSTLLNILSGVFPADSGEVRVAGKPLTHSSPRAARDAGIAMIHQELQQIPELSVAQNLFLGSPAIRARLFTDLPRMRREAADVLKRLDPSIDVWAPIKNLSIAQRQLVEIGRALHLKSRIIAMDEPTSSLTPKEFDRLAEIIAELQGHGVALIYVSHKLDEIRKVCQRATVLRDGKVITDLDVRDTSEQEMVRLMVGRALAARTHTSYRTDKVAVGVQGLSWRKFVKDVTFELHRGEVLGIAGLVGSGRTELVRVIAGLEKQTAGKIFFDSRPVELRSRRHAIRLGVGLVPEERKREAIVPQRPVFTNVGLPNLNKHAVCGLIRFSSLRADAKNLTESMRMRPPDVDRQIRLFSGGNQQKAIIARWLYAKVDILILDEPTRGIDVGAKQDIYKIIEDLARDGKAIIVVSSELEEILWVSDRVLVMRAGSPPTLLNRAELSEESIMQHAVPQTNE